MSSGPALPPVASGGRYDALTAVLGQVRAARPGDLFRPGAIGKVLANNVFPGAEQRRVDAGTARQHGIDDPVGDVGNLAGRGVIVFDVVKDLGDAGLPRFLSRFAHDLREVGGKACEKLGLIRQGDGR